MQSEERRKVDDELAIRDLVARYADAVADRDEHAWADTWTDDGRWLLGFAQADGRDEVVRTWKRLMDTFEFVIQVPEYGTIEVDGTRASGRWTVRELGWPSGSEPTATLGRYRDSYRCEGGRWRFCERRFELLYMGPPDLGGERFGSAASRA